MINTCCAKVGDTWFQTTCGKTAKVTHLGKHYCGLHDPVKKQAKRDAVIAKREADWAALRAAKKAEAAAAAEQKRRADCYDDLLKACQLIVNAFDALAPVSAARHEPLQINAARAAIAKATGAKQ